MKRYWKPSLALVLGGLLVVGFLYAQSPSHEQLPEREGKTKELVELAYDLYTELAMPDHDLRCRLDCRLETVSRGPNDSLLTNTSDISYYGSADRIMVESPDGSFYQDSTVGITILPSRRELHLMPSSSGRLDQGRREMLMQEVYHQLFSQSKNVQSRPVGESGAYELVIVPEKQFQAMYGIRRLTITLHPAERRIRSIRTDYAEGHPYEAMTMIYRSKVCSEPDVASGDPSDAEAPLLERVLTQEGELRPEFRDYAVVDMRREIVE